MATNSLPSQLIDEAEDEENSENSDYIETEPILAYSRMKNDIISILEKDSLSCIRADHKILVLGTHWGKVHIMDHEGNKIITRDIHQSSVNDVAIDSKEEYVASCGDDGKVTIFGLCESTHDQIVEFNHPIKSVEFEPNFSRTFSFATGDTKLVLNEKGFMGRRKTNILHEGEGIIRNIKWAEDLIAWSNDKGVKIYSITEKRIITFVTKDHDPHLRDELYRCTLLWNGPNCLVIGWADRFKICKIIRRSNLVSSTSTHTHGIRGSANAVASTVANTIAATVLSSGAGSFVTSTDKKDFGTYVEITCMVQTDFYICGLAIFSNKANSDEQFLILCYEKDANTTPDLVNSEDSRPHVRVIKVEPDSFEETSLDAVTINDYERNRPCDYRLDYIQDEGLFFILGPKDIIKAMPRSYDDHIRWLMERNEFEQALNDIKNSQPDSLKAYTYQIVALNYVEYLIFSKKYKEAAEWCSRIDLSIKDWEEKIIIFAKEGQLEAIYERIPSMNPTLDPIIYEKVLNEFLRLKNYKIVKELLKKWPCNIYDMKCITNAVVDVQKKDENNQVLLEILAILYEYQKLYDESFRIYILLKDQIVFDFLSKHNLYECGFENIISLIALNKKRGVDILVDNVDKLNIKRVVEKLSKNNLYLHYYLDAIFEKDPNLSKDYHTMQVVLYAEYDRPKLMKFLQNSQYIILAQAQKELQERNLIPEIVYILERMGQIKKALQLILYAIKDVQQAIEFCKKHNDKDLWEDLIQYSLNKPDYIIGLLNNIGTHVDPVDLINRVPNGVKIKGLRDALVKILQDYRVQLSLLEGSKKIISGDCLNLMEKQIRIVRQGICVDDSQKCLICDANLISSSVNALKRIKVFECKHSFHDECISQHTGCTVCSQSKSSFKISD